VLNLFAAVAERERALIASRTRDTLARKRARGEPLGNLASLAASRGKVAAVNRAAADAFAARTLPIIDAIKAAGFTSLRAIAGELTRREVPTARDGAWSADAVRAVLLRA
jgi:DNA invertase Pin-like site-specific DNA recombinase